MAKIYVVIHFSCQFLKLKDANAKKEQHKFNGIFAQRIDTFQDSFAEAYNRKGRSFLEGQSFILSSVSCSSQGQNVINMVSLLTLAFLTQSRYLFSK